MADDTGFAGTSADGFSHFKIGEPLVVTHHGRTCHLSQEAQLGSQDELEGNHLRDLSVSLLSRTQFTMVS